MRLRLKLKEHITIPGADASVVNTIVASL